MSVGAIRARLDLPLIRLVARIALPTESSVWVTAVLVCLGYFLGTKVGFELTFQPHPISMLWPPNSILLAGLVVTRPRYWWLLLSAAFPAHLAAQVQGGVPLLQIIAWFVSNCSEALIGAGCIRYLLRGPLQFDSFRDVCIFIAFGALLAPFVSTFIDVAFVTAIGWGQGSYATLWRLRFFSNVLTSLTLVPVIVTVVTLGPRMLRAPSARCALEAAVVLLGLLTTSFFLFAEGTLNSSAMPALIYAPVPFLLWAALRLGPLGTSLSLLAVTLLAVWGTIHGHGPFVGASAAESALSAQLFLMLLSITLLLLASVIEQNGKTAQALQQSEEQLRLAIGAAQIGTWEWAIPRNQTRWSEESSRILRAVGATAAPTFEGFLELLHPDDREAVRQAVARSIADKLPFEAEFRVVHPDASVRWVLGKGEVLYQASGRPERMLGINVDITDRKRAEEALLLGNQNLRKEIAERSHVEQALRRSEERFAKAFHSGPDAICIMKQADGRLVDVNDRWQILFGLRREQALGRTLAELGLVKNTEDQPRLYELSSAHSRLDDLELSLNTRSGDTLETVLTTVSTEMSGEPCCITVFRDVTRQRRAERDAQEQRQQMAHLTRVAVLGQLSGALAHELNQPLAAILSNAQAAQRFLKREPVDLIEMGAILDDIVNDDKRAGEVIHRLRALLQRGEAQFQTVDFNGVVSETLKLAHSDLMARNVRVSTTWARAVAPVRGDRIQLQQVVLNLIMNASDAMAEIEQSERLLTITIADDLAGHVHASFVDRGHGIPVEQLEKLFEPFFTTKEQGLGLGLSISLSIVNAHSGRLWAESNLDRGATLHLTLPAAG